MTNWRLWIRAYRDNKKQSKKAASSSPAKNLRPGSSRSISKAGKMVPQRNSDSMQQRQRSQAAVRIWEEDRGKKARNNDIQALGLGFSPTLFEVICGTVVVVFFRASFLHWGLAVGVSVGGLLRLRLTIRHFLDLLRMKVLILMLSSNGCVNFEMGFCWIFWALG